MRLLYLTRGCTVHDRRWLRVFRQAGIPVGYLALDPAAARAAVGLEAVRLDLPEGNAAEPDFCRLEEKIEAVRRAWREWQPDVILAGPLTDAGWLATRIDPARTVLASWGFDFWLEPRSCVGAEDRLRETLAEARFLFADCESVARGCAEMVGPAFQGQCVMPWGLAPEDLPTLAVRTRSPGAFTVIHARGFHPVYDPATVIRVFQQSHRSHPELRLWLVGEGPLRGEAEAAVAAANLRESVDFLGRLSPSELANRLVQADAYLACSRCDGSSVTLLQAMHAGLPGIVTNIPGNREWIDADGGWLSPVGDVESFARGIQAAVALKPAQRDLIRARNQAVVRDRANLPRNFPKLLAILNAAARNSLPPATPFAADPA